MSSHNNNNRETRSSRSESFTTVPPGEKTRERRSTDPPEVKSTGFDVHHVYEAFSDSLKEPSNPQSSIGTQDYIDGYRELTKFFDQLGYVFKFVKDDVVEKLGILQKFVDKDKKEPLHFDTIQKGINYEIEQNLIKTNPENFARTLLRLHRALLFIVQFLQALNDRPASDSTSTIASNCYQATLSNYHPFLIRQSAKLGFRVLPSRRQLDDVIFHGHKSELIEQYKSFIQTIKQIYDIVQEFYTEKKLLDLP